MKDDPGHDQQLPPPGAHSSGPSQSDALDPYAQDPTRRTRLSGVWVGVLIGVVVLVVLLVFVLQNTTSVKVSLFSVSGHMPLGVALLLAAVGGVLLASAVSSLRILQLRHRLHARSPRRGPIASRRSHRGGGEGA